MQDANNNRTTSIFDAASRPVATVDANNTRVTQVYDAASQRVALVDGRGNRTSFAFDAAGRQVFNQDALSRRTTMAYDPGSRQTLRIDARGNRTTSSFDDTNRRTGWRYPDGSRVTQTWDAADQRTLLNDSTGRTTTVFDDVGRWKSVTNPANKRITYSWDAVGQRSVMIEPGGGRFTYSFDDAGRFNRLINPQADRTTAVYDTADRRTTLYLANSTRASYTWDDANQLLKLANIRSDATTISSFAYKNDPVGNRTRVVESNGDRVTWTYDPTYQLLSERRSGANAYAITYTYDKSDNRRTMLQSGVTTTYTCDAANQLNWYQDNTGRTTMVYDSNGNQTVQIVPTGGRTTSTWDFENRMTKVALASGILNTMSYDGDGRRVGKDDSSGSSKYVREHRDVLLETDANGSTLVINTFESEIPGVILSQRRSGTSSYFAFDGFGSTDRLTDSGGVVSDGFVYEAFGTIVFSSGSTQTPYKYGGSFGLYFDNDTQRLYAFTTYLLPLIGRWLSKTSSALRLSQTNAYRYRGNGPYGVSRSTRSPAANPEGGKVGGAPNVNCGPQANAIVPPDIGQPPKTVPSYKLKHCYLALGSIHRDPKFKCKGKYEWDAYQLNQPNLLAMCECMKSCGVKCDRLTLSGHGVSGAPVGFGEMRMYCIRRNGQLFLEGGFGEVMECLSEVMEPNSYLTLASCKTGDPLDYFGDCLKFLAKILKKKVCACTGCPEILEDCSTPKCLDGDWCCADP